MITTKALVKPVKIIEIELSLIFEHLDINDR